MNYEEEYLLMYEYILNYVKKNLHAPTIREIKSSGKLKSTGTVHSYLKRMEDEGLISIINYKIIIKGYKMVPITDLVPRPEDYKIKIKDKYKLMYEYIINYSKEYLNTPTCEEIHKSVKMSIGTIYNYLNVMQKDGLLELKNHKIVIKGYKIVPIKEEPIPKPGILKKALTEKIREKRKKKCLEPAVKTQKN